MSDLLRILLFVAVAAGCGVLFRWLAGVVAVRLGHPRAAGQRAVASGGLSLLYEPARPKPLIPVSKKDERLALVEAKKPGVRSRPSGLARERQFVPTRLDERD